MLIEFRVENHRSLLTEQVLSMQAARAAEDDAPVRPEDLLPVAVLYGANASGKSNVLGALQFMRDAVLFSHSRWSPDGGFPRDPFAWGLVRDAPSVFEVSILVNGSRFDYGFAANDAVLLEEWLYTWADGEKIAWFERDSQEFRFADDLPGSNRMLQEVTRPNALFLSVASQHNHPRLSQIYSWFNTLNSINVLPPSKLVGTFPLRSLRMMVSYGGNLPALLNEATDPRAADGVPGSSFRDRLLKLLRTADTGIVGIKHVPPDPEETRTWTLFPSYLLKHQNDSAEAWLPLEQESQGTRTLMRIGLPILEAIEQGGILLIDELESSLHPMLAREIVRQFNDPTSNFRNAQLIFTTHDTNLLGNVAGDPVVKRDQVWLTEKDNQGATVLYPLTDYKPRDAENLERGYLQGRYGAIPFLGNFSLTGE